MCIDRSNGQAAHPMVDTGLKGAAVPEHSLGTRVGRPTGRGREQRPGFEPLGPVDARIVPGAWGDSG